MRNKCGLRTSSVKALELVTPNGHEQPCLWSLNDCFMAVSRGVHGRLAVLIPYATVDQARVKSKGMLVF